MKSTTSSESLYETLFNQIEAPLFPTEFSQKIAHEIIENINEEGFFEGSLEEIAQKFDVNPQDVESIRQRFAYLEPVGVGAVDFKESFLFQAMDLELDSDLHEMVKRLIFDFEHLESHSNELRFAQAKAIIKRLKNPPAIDFFEESRAIIPEVIVATDNEGIRVNINSACYPEVSIKKELKGIKGEFGAEKKKEAKRLTELLELRKSTLFDIANFVAKRQIGFFYGEELAPLAMREVADEFGYSQSTISRAIAGKYLQCERGVFALKSMFAYTIGENVSNENIKRFVYETIQNESKQKPLSDEKILHIVNERFHVNLVRRSITKYRLEMGVGSSSQRKSA